MTGPRYPIRAVARLTGITVDTLRAWERRYRAVEPDRDDRGRIYSDADVERLRLLRRGVEAGHAIGRIAPLSARELRALLVQPEDAVELRLAAPASLAPLREAIDRFDGPAFRRELSRMAAVVSARALCREVVLPLLRGVGDAWHAGELTVAQEHLVSAELRSLLGALARLHELRSATGAVVFATPEGELHELGTLAAAVIAADVGLGALFLGASLPAREIVAAAERVAAPAVVLGWSGAGHDGGSAARAALAEVARDLPRRVELWVGGAGARDGAAATGRRALALESFDAYERELARLARR